MIDFRARATSSYARILSVLARPRREGFIVEFEVAQKIDRCVLSYPDVAKVLEIRALKPKF